MTLAVICALTAAAEPRRTVRAANVRQLAAKAPKNKHVHMKPYQAKDAGKAAKRKPEKRDVIRYGLPDGKNRRPR